jgi:fluoride ion exporter CrcB/FEX
MFIPLGTLLVIILVAFMLGMLTSFLMVIQAMLRYKK